MAASLSLSPAPGCLASSPRQGTPSPAPPPQNGRRGTDSRSRKDARGEDVPAPSRAEAPSLSPVSAEALGRPAGACWVSCARYAPGLHSRGGEEEAREKNRKSCSAFSERSSVAKGRWHKASLLTARPALVRLGPIKKHSRGSDSASHVHTANPAAGRRREGGQNQGTSSVGLWAAAAKARGFLQLDPG